MDCSNVYIKEVIKNNQKMKGVFTKIYIPKDSIIEYGISSIIVADGNKNPHLFTWSDNTPNNTWAALSGCAPFYNTSLEPNCKIIRDFKNNTFEIISLVDLEKDTELMHTYKSLSWRLCFKDLNNMLNFEKPFDYKNINSGCLMRN